MPIERVDIRVEQRQEYFKYPTFCMDSWTLNQYKEACKDSRFYETIKKRLIPIENGELNTANGEDHESNTADGSSSQDTLIQGKFDIAGHSARF